MKDTLCCLLKQTGNCSLQGPLLAGVAWDLHEKRALQTDSGRLQALLLIPGHICFSRGTLTDSCYTQDMSTGTGTDTLVICQPWAPLEKQFWLQLTRSRMQRSEQHHLDALSADCGYHTGPEALCTNKYFKLYLLLDTCIRTFYSSITTSKKCS